MQFSYLLSFWQGKKKKEKNNFLKVVFALKTCFYLFHFRTEVFNWSESENSDIDHFQHCSDFLIVCVYGDYKTSYLSPKFAVNNSFLRNAHSSKGRKTVWRPWRPWLARSRPAPAFARQVSFSLKTSAGRVPVTLALTQSSDVSVRIFPAWCNSWRAYWVVCWPLISPGQYSTLCPLRSTSTRMELREMNFQLRKREKIRGNQMIPVS